MWYKLQGGGGNATHRPASATSSYDRGVLQCYFKSRSVQLKEIQCSQFYRLAGSYLPLFLFVLTESKMRKYMTAGEQVSRTFAGQ